MVYARTVGADSLTFQVSGMLWRNSLIMIDRESETWWSHVTGEALKGSKKGAQLEIIPSTQSTWGEWRAAHPDSELLAKQEEVLDSRYRSYFDDPERTGLLRAQWLTEKMPGKTLVWGIRHGVHAAAVTDHALIGDGMAELDLGGNPVVAIFGPDGGVRAFVAEAGETPLRLTRTAVGALSDPARGSTWDPLTGRAVDGSQTGNDLAELPVTRVFWFAWSSFYPNTQVVE